MTVIVLRSKHRDTVVRTRNDPAYTNGLFLSHLVFHILQCLIASLACETKFRALQHPEHSEGATKISYSMFYKKVEEVGG